MDPSAILSNHMTAQNYLYVTPDPGNMMLSFGLSRNQPHMWFTGILADKSLIYIK